MAVLLPPKFKPGNVSPILGYGMKQSRSAFLAGVAIGGSMLVVIALLSTLVLGPELIFAQLFRMKLARPRTPTGRNHSSGIGQSYG